MAEPQRLVGPGPSAGSVVRAPDPSPDPLPSAPPEPSPALVSHGRRDQAVVAVGGGADLLPDTIAGRAVERSRYGGVANAAGAAIALISGEYETLVPADAGRAEALADARAEAVGRAVAAGEAPEHTGVVRIREVPVSYAGRPCLRVTVKAAGRLRSA
ncbi:hypothetical protein [Kitasatospora sp. NBC_00315]|uniref:hypothetical protein n=1 Tax=Kitasatospora sp. NBC_00315 TaxID=2975963 RepID=UPI003243856B